MADLVQFRGQVTSQDSLGVVSVVANRKVLVTKRGATLKGANSAVQPVYNGGLRFAVGDKVIVPGNASSFRTIQAVFALTITVPSTINTSDGDRLINLGADTGGASPNFDGADSKVSIYSVPDDTTTAIVDNKITTDADGEYGFYAVAGVYDVSIMDSSDALGATSQTNADIELDGNIIKSDHDEGATAIAHEFDTDRAWTTAGGLLMSLKNNGTAKFTVDKDGDIVGVDATLSGNTSVTGTLHSTGNLDTDGTLVVDGASTLTGAVSCGATLHATGNLDTDGTLVVDGASTLTGATAVTADLTAASDIIINVAGKALKVKEGANATMGTATLDGASPSTVTVSTTAVTATSRIFITEFGQAAAPTAIAVGTRVAATSFNITGANGSTGTIAWHIVEPA